MAAESASTDITLLCHSPQSIAEAYARAESSLGDCRERLSWKLGFIDSLQRFLCGVMAAEVRGLGLPFPPAYSQSLCMRLDRPSLGNWGTAARHLANTLLLCRKPLVIPELPRLIVSRPDPLRPESSRFNNDLKELTWRRNTICHTDGRFMIGEDDARRMLPDVNATLRRVVLELRIFRNYPVLYMDGQSRSPSGGVIVRLLRYCGRSPERLPEISTDREFGVPDHIPFILGPGGEALSLAPFVVVGTSEHCNLPSLHLFARWRGKAQYSDPAGFEEDAPQGSFPGQTTSGEELATLKSFQTRWQACSPALATTLLSSAHNPPRPELPGWTIDGLLGRGASSSVYLARETAAASPQATAVKVLDQAVVQDPMQRARLGDEYRILKELSHPGIIKVYSFAESPVVHVSMEFLPGGDLQTALERERLSPTKAAGIIRQVLEALRLVHRRDIIHRDIKPSNLMLDAEGRVRLIDFGIAKVEKFAKKTRSLEVVGTTLFAAPEQLEGRLDIDHRADLYSLGKTFEHLLTAGKEDPLSLPPGIRAIVHRALQYNPDHRYQTAEEFLDALEQREKAGWGGPPIQPGDLLGTSHLLGDPVLETDGLWLFRGVERASGEEVSIAVPVAGEAAVDRLKLAVAVASPQVRARTGYRGINFIDDGRTPYIVFSPEWAEANLRALLDNAPPSSAKRDSFTFSVAKPPADMPGYLVGFWHKMSFLDFESAPFLPFLAAENLLRILALLKGAALRRPIRPDSWALRPFLWEEFDLWGDADTLDAPVKQGLKRLQEARNRYAHGVIEENAPAPKKSIIASKILSPLLDACCRWSLKVPDPEALRPLLTRIRYEDGGAGWGLVISSANGTMSFLDLDQSSLGQMPPGLESELIRMGFKSNADATRSRLSLEALSPVSDWFPELRLMREVGFTSSGRKAVADAVFYADEQVAFVVEVKFDLITHRARAIEILTAACSSMGTPLAALTDGRTWAFFDFSRASPHVAPEDFPERLAMHLSGTPPDEANAMPASS